MSTKVHGHVRYAGYSPRTEECTYVATKHFAADLPPLPTAKLLEAAPELLACVEHIANCGRRICGECTARIVDSLNAARMEW